MYAYLVTIYKTQFYKNRATSLSKNLFIGFSNVTIDTCTFEDSLIPSNTQLTTQGTFINLMMSVDLNVKGSSFVNGDSQMGGAIYLSGGN